MIGAVPATHGDPIVAHPSTSVRALGRFRGRARRADGHVGCAWTVRGARCERGRQKVLDYRPAGAIFLQSPPGSMKTRSRTRRSCLRVVPAALRVFEPNTTPGSTDSNSSKNRLDTNILKYSTCVDTL